MNLENETLRLLHRRKSVRVFADKPVAYETVTTLMEAALSAPTAGNMCLWTALHITDPKLKQTLAVTCDNQPFIAKAPLLLLFCVDYARWHALFEKDAQEAGEQTRAPGVGDLFLAFEDTMIAAQTAVIAAESLGLGSCYIGDILENCEKHRELLHLPPHVIPAALLCFGYPTQGQLERTKPPRFAVEEVLCENVYAPGFIGEFEGALMRRQELDEKRFASWLAKFRKRKWDSDFSREMTRSCEVMLSRWRSGNERD